MISRNDFLPKNLILRINDGALHPLHLNELQELLHVPEDVELEEGYDDYEEVETVYKETIR